MEMLKQATARVHGAVDQVADAAAPAAKWLEDQGTALNSGSEKFVDSTSRYIAAHPLQSLGIALAVGYLISRFTR